MAKTFFIIIGILFLGGCALQKTSEPFVEFSRIPPAEIGGTVRLEDIAGRVVNPRPACKIVIYTRSGKWYVQPFANKPFTDIEADSTWKTPTHLGTEYAALLVTPEFVPPPTMVDLPEKGGAIIAVSVVNGTPRYWQTWWFRTLLVLFGVFLIITFLRLRFQKITNEMNVRFEERLAERTRIAQELHDSLLQGFVGVSMQINVAVEQLPEHSPVKPQLEKITKTIGQVIEEGRNTVQGLRSFEREDFVNLERRFSQMRSDLDAERKTDFQFVEKGLPRKLCPVIADEIYYIGREALVNAFHHSGAGKIVIETEYGAKNFTITIRDDGSGIDSKIIEAGREGHWGISGMRERAGKIGANLKISSRVGSGTEIEFSISNQAAFENSDGKRAFGFLSKFYPRRKKELT